MACGPRSAAGLRACVVCGVVNMRRVCSRPLHGLRTWAILNRMRCQHEGGIRSGAAHAPSLTRDGWDMRCFI